MRRRHRLSTLAVAAAITLAVVVPPSGCGYTLVGRGAFLPEYIRTVAIPTFVNNTDRFELEVRVTDFVTREFVSRGGYRVVGSDDGADAVLRGEMLAFDVRPVGLDRGQEARTWEATIRARVTFTDLVENRVLYTNGAFLFRDEFEYPATTLGVVDIEVGVIDEIAVEFARSVVSSILEGF